MSPLLRLVHPFPSALNSAAVFAIAVVAGADLPVATLLAVAMLGLQFCIGAVNDLFDESLDALTKPYKPIPAGAVSRHTAWVIAGVCGCVGLVGSAAVRFPDAWPTIMALIMLGAGLAYDAWLKPTAFGWVCFAVALPVLPVYAWYGATGDLPPGWHVLAPVAALAGLGLQLSNGLIDAESDRAAGARTLVVSLGRRRALPLMAAAVAGVHVLAWLTLGSSVAPIVPALAGVAAALALGGVVASAQTEIFLRQVGWTAQATAVALVAVAWLAGAAGAGAG